MGYSWDKFLKPLSTTDTNIQIMDNDGVVKYTLNPYAILNVLVNNNLLKINLKSGSLISIPFSTTNESKLAITKIKELIDDLTIKTPNFLTKDVKNYVQSVIGTSSTSGTSGTSGIDGTSGTSGTSGIDGTSGTTGVTDTFLTGDGRTATVVDGLIISII